MSSRLILGSFLIVGVIGTSRLILFPSQHFEQPFLIIQLHTVTRKHSLCSHLHLLGLQPFQRQMIANRSAFFERHHADIDLHLRT